MRGEFARSESAILANRLLTPMGDGMRTAALVFGILFIVLAVVVFVFAEGLRRYYSGIFFAILGTVTLVNALRRQRDADK